MKRMIVFFILLFSVLFLTQCTIVVYRSAVRDTPPDAVFAEDPDLIIISGTYVYYADEYDGDLFFAGGYWWRPRHNVWYRAGIYSGPWIVVEERSVPYNIIHLPPRWREMRDNEPRMRWSEVRENWQGWERDKYWDRHNWKREDIKRDEGNRRDDNKEIEIKKDDNERKEILKKPVIRKQPDNEKERPGNNKEKKRKGR